MTLYCLTIRIRKSNAEKTLIFTSMTERAIAIAEMDAMIDVVREFQAPSTLSAGKD